MADIINISRYSERAKASLVFQLAIVKIMQINTLWFQTIIIYFLGCARLEQPYCLSSSSETSRLDGAHSSYTYGRSTNKKVQCLLRPSLQTNTLSLLLTCCWLKQATWLSPKVRIWVVHLIQ